MSKSGMAFRDSSTAHSYIPHSLCKKLLLLGLFQRELFACTISEMSCSQIWRYWIALWKKVEGRSLNDTDLLSVSAVLH